MEIINLILAAILLIAIFFALIFLYSKFIRFFKKKSHHHIVSPTPEKDKNWHPIDFNNYNSYIFINNIEIDITKNFTEPFLKLKSNASTISDSNILIQKSTTGTIVEIKDSSFGDYVSLFKWFIDNPKISNQPSEVVAFCQNKDRPLQDFLFKIDKVLTHEYCIGSFRTGKNFGIYLPHIDLNESGNISLSRNNEVSFSLEISKLPLESINLN